jgi:polyisoprenoid-binding protein YceI
MRTARLLPALALATLAAAARPAVAQQAARPAAAAVGAAARSAPAALATYQIDATHSELSFRIRHMLGRVNGTFGEWGGTIAVDSAAPANSRVDVSIKTASIDTKNERRDGHLRSAEFFAPTASRPSRSRARRSTCAARRSRCMAT